MAGHVTHTLILGWELAGNVTYTLNLGGGGWSCHSYINPRVGVGW